MKMKSIIDDYNRKNKRYSFKDVKEFSYEIKEVGNKTKPIVAGMRKTARQFSPSSRVTHSSMGKRIVSTQREAEEKQKKFMR
jgi:hypothetical protein